MRAHPLVTLGMCAVLAGCGDGPGEPAAADRPNLLWIVWDTVRADHTSLHGYSRDTTPFLAVYAADARVFEQCRSTAPNTTASHASMFTGLFPTEHGADNRPTLLAPRFETFAERVAASGYSTFLWSANPHVAEVHGLGQGFQTELHPWSPGWRERSQAAAQANASGVRDPGAKDPGIHATGELGNEALLEWIDTGSERPWFAFVNLMEAHRPYLPREEHLVRLGGEEGARAVRELDDGVARLRAFNLGVAEYTPGELESVALAYDACIARLDVLFEELIGALEQRGELENTIVVLTSDHGEHLGEHHLLDHQYSVYEELLHVPLVVRVPRGLAGFSALGPGREVAPVQLIDLFPTLLEACGVPGREDADPRVRALNAPDPERRSLAEYFAPPKSWIREIERNYPGVDGARFIRDLTAWQAGDWKLIQASGGESRLFDLRKGGEARDLAGENPERRAALNRELEDVLRALVPAPRVPSRTRAKDRERLEALGYVGD